MVLNVSLNATHILWNENSLRNCFGASALMKLNTLKLKRNNYIFGNGPLTENMRNNTCMLPPARDEESERERQGAKTNQFHLMCVFSNLPIFAMVSPQSLRQVHRNSQFGGERKTWYPNYTHTIRNRRLSNRTENICLKQYPLALRWCDWLNAQCSHFEFHLFYYLWHQRTQVAFLSFHGAKLKGFFFLLFRWHSIDVDTSQKYVKYLCWTKLFVTGNQPASINSLIDSTYDERIPF